jgi:Flp pilus assembly protein TadD
MEEHKTETKELEKMKQTKIVDPTPDRKKMIVKLLYDFAKDKVSLAELKGISKRKLYQLADVGHVRFMHGRVEEAENIFQALILLDHRNAFFHSVMGAIHQKKKRPVEAIYEFSMALKLDGKDVAAFVNRGEIYLRHKNYRKAAEDFKSAILIDMSGRNLWANRARSLVIAIKRQLEGEKEKRNKIAETRRQLTHSK